MSSVDEDTPPVGAVVGVVISALIILTIVIAAIVVVAGFAQWWNEEDGETLDLKTDVSVECTILRVASMCLYMGQDAVFNLYNYVVMYRTGNYGDFIGHFDDLVENCQIELHQCLYMHNYSLLN